MSKIVFESSAIDEGIVQLLELNENINKKIEHLCKNINEIKNSWSSPASSQYMENYTREIKEIDGVREEIIKQHIGLLKAINIEYKVVEDENKELSERFL